jgi:hypothetical protein
VRGGKGLVSAEPASVDHVLDLLIAAGVIPSPEGMAERHVALLARAQIPLRCQITEALERGPSWGFLVSEQDFIEPEGDPVTLARLAALEPGDPWVELILLADLAEQVRPNPGVGPRLARLVQEPVPPGYVRVVLGTIDGVVTLPVHIRPLEHQA